MSINLHAAVRGIVGAMNADTAGFILRSAGFVTYADGRQAPEYLQAQSVMMQVQPVDLKTAQQLFHENYLSMQSIARSVYLYGDTQGVMRPLVRGGDLLQFPEYPGAVLSTWLVTTVIETWAPGWSHVIVTLQTDNTP